MLAKDIAAVLEEWAPPTFAENYDNVGLLVGSPDQEVKGMLINLDMTEEVIEEAVNRGCNMVIAHHPIWFVGLKRLNGRDYVSKAIMKAIKHDILLYAIHTNLDNVRTGVNQKIAEKLGLERVEILKPKIIAPEVGSGMIGYLDAPMSKHDFLQKVKDTFGCGGIRYADFPKNEVRKIAICGGSGSFLTHDAISAGADVLLTADVTYHKFFDNEKRILLLDIGHYESEQYTSELIETYLKKKFSNFAIHLSEIRTNPVQYFP